MAAFGTNKSLRPTHPEQIVVTGFLSSESFFKFDLAFWKVFCDVKYCHNRPPLCFLRPLSHRTLTDTDKLKTLFFITWSFWITRLTYLTNQRKPTIYQSIPGMLGMQPISRWKFYRSAPFSFPKIVAIWKYKD